MRVCACHALSFKFKHMKKKYIFFLFIIFSTSITIGQNYSSINRPIERPDWTYELPAQGENSDYFYVRGYGNGATQKQAVDEAIEDAYRKIKERYTRISSATETTKLEICSWSIKTEKGFEVYKLYQVVNNNYQAGIKVQFNDCNTSKIYERQLAEYNAQIEEAIAAADKYNTSIIASSFVPGMAQIKKGSTGKGVGFICGEVVFVGGTIVSECLYRQYKSQINSVSGSNLNKFMQAANICQITRNVCIAGIAATYIWNVIDGIVAKDYNKPSFGSTTFQFSPYVSLEDAGMAVNITF